MASKIPLYGLVMAAAAGLFGSPGVALSHSDAHNLQIYAGEILGDRLTAIRLSGRTPVLNDNATFGARYTYGLSQWFALQLSAGYSPGRVARVASGNTTLDLTTADLDLLFDVTPTLTVNGRHLMLYTELGAGYAWVSLHHPLLGSIDSAGAAHREQRLHRQCRPWCAVLPHGEFLHKPRCALSVYEQARQPLQPGAEYRRNDVRHRLQILMRRPAGTALLTTASAAR